MTPEQEAKYLRLLEKWMLGATLTHFGIELTEDAKFTKDEEEFFLKWRDYKMGLANE